MGINPYEILVKGVANGAGGAYLVQVFSKVLSPMPVPAMMPKGPDGWKPLRGGGARQAPASGKAIATATDVGLGVGEGGRHPIFVVPSGIFFTATSPRRQP